jgi:N-acetylglucosaminyldiphosphoundecaprenol N-acetyl-beta-D-mannosaminyltransferase
MPEIDILGVNVDVIDREGLHREIVESIGRGEKCVLAYVNVNALNIARRERKFQEFLNRATVVYCDGEGVRLGARILGGKLPPRIVLTYWIWQLCALVEQNGFTMYLLGSTEEAVEKAVANLKSKFPRLSIAGWHHGYFRKSGPESDAVVDMINRARPNLLFVGFGMPMQEHWISDNLARLDAEVILPAGSMIDYVAGLKGLAPSWMSGHGMEWLYRLLEEPGRLWKRYLVGNPMFLARVLLQRLMKGRQS